MHRIHSPVFEHFENGRLAASTTETNFAPLPWNNHPKFEGVALKNLVTASDTGNRFSYHLVRIDHGCAIGDHLHHPQLETHEVIAGHGKCILGDTVHTYVPGVIAILPAGVRHSVQAGTEGLLLFAKFFPPLA